MPLLPPRIGVERADSAVVRRVRADEEAAERERQREENVMREPHSGIAIARRWRELQQQASTPVGQTSEREAAGAVSPFPLPVTIPNAFRPKRKIGQIYVNIPGRGRFHVQAEGVDPNCPNRALDAAKKAFWDEYLRSRASGSEVVSGDVR